MKLIVSLLTFVTLFSLVSCGPSAEEKAAIEKHNADSITEATEQALLDKMEMQQTLQDSLIVAETDKEVLEMMLSETKAQLAVEEDKMVRIKEWQLGRAPSEREEQIRNQTILIEGLQKDIETMTEDLANSEENISSIEKELKKYE